jgi:glycosidase
MRPHSARLLLAAGCLAIFTPVRAQQSPPGTKPDTAWVQRSALYEVFVQDFSPQGTLRGVIDGLYRIQASGANVVWIMPVHPIGVAGRKGTLGSPYAVKDFRAVNPAYGTADDFRALVEAAHGRGLKVILDWVPDHTALDHRWIRARPAFYFKNDRGEPSVPREPSGTLTDWTDVAQLDYGNADLRREMIATMRWWLGEFGLDGFRVDVAGFLPNAFWREAVPALRASVPRRLLLLAEWDDPELHRLGYDLTYGWDSYDRLKEVWQGKPAADFVQRAMADLATLPSGAGRMRFTTNHDKTAWEDPPLTIFHDSAGARAAYVAVALLPGRPLLYNGQEVESPQKLALFEPDPIEWKQPHAAEAQAFYRRVVQLARTDAAFLGRDLKPVESSAPKDVIAYRRGDALVLVNVRKRAIRVTVSDERLDGAKDLLTDREQRGETVALPAYGVVVLRPR